MHQVGFQDVILPLVKSALSKFVFTGIGWSVVVYVMIAAAGRRSSVSATVVDSSSTNSRDHHFAVCVTVESEVGNYDIIQNYGEKKTLQKPCTIILACRIQKDRDQSK